MRRFCRILSRALFLLLAIAAVAFLFTEGFAYEVEPGGRVRHVAELLSSGAGDNRAPLLIAFLLFISFAARLSPKRLPLRVEAPVFALLWLLSACVLASLQAASLRLTLVHDCNLALLLWLAAYLLLPPALALEWSLERRESRSSQQSPKA